MPNARDNESNNKLRPRRFDDVEACLDALLAQVGRELRVAAPLGLGKPNSLLNGLYRRAKADASIKLHLFTALTLAPPATGKGLKERLAGPVTRRLFEGYETLDYWDALRRDALPDNVRITEFFFQPGAMLGRRQAQYDYLSSNYTHVGRDLRAAGVNVFLQLVAPHPDSGASEWVSLSSNPDVTLEMLPYIRARRAAGEPIAVFGQVHAQLPYMGRDAVVPVTHFDGLLESTDYDYRLFGTPAAAVSPADHAIGLQVSALLKDGGTLQIGIGALSDAIAWSASLRQQDNATYREAVSAMRGLPSELIEHEGGTDRFRRGLYGCTEMLVEAYLHLQQAGVITRRVFPDAALQRVLDESGLPPLPSEALLDRLVDAGRISSQLGREDVDWLKRVGLFRDDVYWAAGRLEREGIPSIGADLEREENMQAVCDHCLGHALADGCLIHGGFFLGRESFYRSLRSLPPEKRDDICMTSVAQINQLYGGEALRAAQRRHARFINTGLKVTLMGAVVSDGLESGQVLSGVGGQYNFVAQAHELPEARSIICIRATRGAGSGLESNIVWTYGHVTIPRHLRDIVVTEYGVADLRGRTDAEVIAALIDIADARFQDSLLDAAIAAGKLPRDHQVAAHARHNLPATVSKRLAAPGSDCFPAFPYGSEFSDEEIVLGRALRRLDGYSTGARAAAVARHFRQLLKPQAAHVPYLQRMGLAHPASLKARLQARLVSLALLEDARD